ncbi:uncharacterized protein LOC122370013 [Amphibalanus amphitrite]|uniref:uncharacterized protein LOC122370013 n=1 Tax=Amphibalanus amphitrite TaxID=1232801 RepID=UPI001C900722|nr:uncharacterized protein LOC122370013 [Amphibalanus amphitrite]
MQVSLKILISIMLSAELTDFPMPIRSEPQFNIARNKGYPKISIVPTQFSEARIEQGHESGDDAAEYPSIRIALNDEESAEISQPLPLNESVHGVLGERDVKMYASRLPPSGGGALKLFVQARGRPEPSEAAPLIVSVRTRDGGYTFTLPQLNKRDTHPHASPEGDHPATTQSPISVYSMSVSRFMCPSAGERDVCYVTMGVGTSVGPDMGHIVYDYDLRLMELDADFWYLDTSSSPRGVLITPVMPALFQYRWPLDPSVQAVRVAVASGESLDCTADNRPCVGEDCSEESDADSCAFLAVHNPICPLTLTQADILSSAWHLSFTRCGTMVVRRKQFPDGFFVSVLLNSDDRPCCPRDSCSKNKTMTPRRKVVRTSVMKYEANFRAASAPSVMGAFFILIGLLSVCLRPVLARAAISSSWEPVAVAKAISSRILGQPDMESFPHGLELHENEESDTGVVLDTSKLHPGDYTPYHKSGLKAESATVARSGNSPSDVGGVSHSNSWPSNVNPSVVDQRKTEVSNASGKGTSYKGNSALSPIASLQEQSDAGAAGPMGSLKSEISSPQHINRTWSPLASDDAHATVQVKRYKAPIATETVMYSDRRATEPTYVHFSGTSDPEKGTTTRRTTGNSLQVPGRETAPETTARVPNTVVLNPVSLQLTCALLIAAFGISNVAIDVAAERRTGNFDRCYRNDLCCHNGQVMPDLNHLLSNVPYIGAGIGFLLAVYAQWHVYEIAGDHGRGVPRGVPHDFNMFTTIGAALAIEGVTSGLYHVCPNNRNSHIDFFFIYYLCAAMGAKLFQTRRGVTTRFHYTPALLVATITLLGSLQQVPGMTPHSWQLAVVLTHFSSSFLWAAQMYLTGHVGLFVPWCWEITSDLRTRRLAAAHIILNGGLALWGLFWPDSGSDVFHSSTYALLYFSLNSGMYVFYYMIMKLVVCRERPPGLSVFNILVGIASAVPALYFFVIRKSYNTNESPALSRTVNHPCVMFDFYDGHDIWHFLSASALFFLMLGVLTLDDDLLATPRDRIPVF